MSHPVTDDEVEHVKKLIVDIRTGLTLRLPFISSLLRRCRIMATRSIPIAAVNKEYQLLVNPDFFLDKDVSMGDKGYVLIHENMHLALQHVIEKLRQSVWALACEIPANRFAAGALTPSPGLWNDLITHDSLQKNVSDLIGIINKYSPVKLDAGHTPRLPAPDDLKKWSTEEVYLELCKLPEVKVKLKSFGRGGSGVPNPFLTADIDGDDGCFSKHDDGKMVERGDSDIYRKNASKEELGKAWSESFIRDYLSHKSIGRLPAGIEEIVDQILKPQVDWRSQLKQCITDGQGRMVISTYHRPSRKNPLLPGLMRYQYPPIRVLIDTSGSIGTQQLQQFLGEVYALAQQSPVIVNYWDAAVYENIRANKPQEVISQVATHIKGRGGTVIKPALEYMLRDMTNHSVLIIFTDGFIYDVGKVGGLMRELGSRASSAIYVSTHTIHNFEGWRSIKITAG